VALARYQATRERLSRELNDATEAIASYTWDLAGLRGLLRKVSAAMSDEVNHLQGLPQRMGSAVVATARPVSSRRHPD